ncbi:MAG: hypothetical protein QF815_03465 [Candidatus Peribacteraceae bacterium]|jgi:hypothetical protein|nr:hypothetical protein [Candidatus Peribacteraceae bacterium]MDP7477518.1 hypothetical protein [Candidatus Peribacteraceae bacterium]
MALPPLAMVQYSPLSHMGITSIKTGLLALAMVAGISASQSVAAANSTIHVDQKSPTAELAQWTLTYPNGAEYTSHLKAKILNTLSAGTYRLTVRAPENAYTTISIFKNSVVLKEGTVTSMTFDLADGETLRAQISYMYTGTVKVMSDLDNVPFEMVGPDGARFTGTTPAVFTEMPPVWYRVTYGVEGSCEVHERQERNLIEGSTLIFYANFECGPKPISLAGRTPEVLATDKTRTRSPMNPYHTDTPDKRVIQTSNYSEVIPGGRMRFSISIRNTTRSTLHNVLVTDQFNPESLEILNLLDGGIIDGNMMKWEIPEVFAGQTWTTTFEARAKDHLVAGDRIVLLAHAVSDESDSDLYPEAWSSVVGVGIAYMPQTGGKYDVLLAIAALMGAAIITQLTIRKQKFVANLTA